MNISYDSDMNQFNASAGCRDRKYRLLKTGRLILARIVKDKQPQQS
jgi:hypothetical protein